MKTKTLLLLFAIAMFTSCSGTSQESLDEGDANNNDKAEVVVTFPGITFSQEDIPILKATTASDFVSRIVLKVFDSNNQEVKLVEQYKGDEGVDFGTIKFKLPFGTYTFVAVAHKSVSGEMGFASITSSTEATIPGTTLPISYSNSQTVEVNNGDALPVSMELKCNNAIFTLKSSETAIPAEVSSIKVTLNSDKEAPTSLAFNPTGHVTDALYKYVRDSKILSYDASINTDNFMFLPTLEETKIKVKVETFNSSSEILSSYVINDVPMKVNRKTIATGNIFSADITTTFTFLPLDEAKEITF